MQNSSDLNNIANDLNKLLRCGKEGLAANKITEFIDALQNNIESNKLVIDQNISNMLNVMANAQQSRDTIFYADILVYELMPYINQKLTT